MARSTVHVRAWLASLLSTTLIAAATAHASAQVDCAATVHLVGDAAAATLLGDVLTQRGLHVVADDGCASVTVEVRAEGSRFRITLLDGREAAMRELDRIETAAVLVESWVGAAEVDLLEPAPAGEAIAEVDAPREAPAAELGATTPATASPPTGNGTVLALGELTFGADGSSWFGARLGACGTVGPFCLGGSLRYLADTGLSEGTLGEGESRAYLGGDIDFALPIAVSDTLRVVPAVAVGLGWMHITTVDGARTARIDEARARLGAGVSGAVRMIDWLFLELGASFAWSPLAHSAPWVADAIAIDPDPPFYGSVQLGLRAELR